MVGESLSDFVNRCLTLCCSCRSADSDFWQVECVRVPLWLHTAQGWDTTLPRDAGTVGHCSEAITGVWQWTASNLILHIWDRLKKLVDYTDLHILFLGQTPAYVGGYNRHEVTCIGRPNAVSWDSCASIGCALLSYFNSHFSRWTRVSHVSILDFIGAKDNRVGGDNWSYKTCKPSVNSSTPTKPTPVLKARCPSLHPVPCIKFSVNADSALTCYALQYISSCWSVCTSVIVKHYWLQDAARVSRHHCSKHPDRRLKIWVWEGHPACRKILLQQSKEEWLVVVWTVM